MASVFKRESDKARGKAGKWTMQYKGADGKFRTRVGTHDKAESLKLAVHLESQATLVREGMVDPAVAAARKHGSTPLADHLKAFGDHLRAKGDSAPYCKRVPPAVAKVLAAAGIDSIAAINPPAIQGAVGRRKDAGRAARSCNLDLALVKSFVAWLDASGRIESVPKGMDALASYNEEADRRRVRRALTTAELDRLLAATEAGAPLKLSRKGYQYAERWMSGPERAAIYRLAMGTGFRVDELRTLTPERFDLDGPEPTVTVLAEHAKNGKKTRQPITADLAARLRPFVAGKPPGAPVLPVPMRMADFIRRDLKAAGIPYETGQGVVDFHALRHSYITHLIAAGVNPKLVQVLARHSTITLTLDRYIHVTEGDLRSALEGKK